MSWLEALIAMLLSLTGAATATEPADRVNPPEATIVVDSAPSTTALDLGTLDGCDLMHALRYTAGLPPVFDGIGWRESNCRNDVTSPTGCCVGYWQLHSIVFRDHRTAAGMAACGATWANVRGNDMASKVRQACAARVLYDVDGMTPWAATS